MVIRTSMKPRSGGSWRRCRRLRAELRGGWPVNQTGWPAGNVRAEADPAIGPGLRGRVQLLAGAGELPGRRDGVCRREEPSSYEAGLRAHGSNQRFHRLLGHAVARALNTAPRLTGLGPAAPGRFSSFRGGGARGPPGRLSRKGRGSRCACGCWQQRRWWRVRPERRCDCGGGRFRPPQWRSGDDGAW